MQTPQVLTCASLDSGSNTTFCSHQLMEMLPVDGEQTTLQLTTLGKQNSVTECRVFRLEVLALDEQNFVKLPTIFSTLQLPVSKDSIPQQGDVSKYPHLKDIQLPKIDAPIGLLIGNDAVNALEPKQVIGSKDKGAYAVKKKSLDGRSMDLWTEREIHVALQISSKPTMNSANSSQGSATKSSVTQHTTRMQGCA